MFKMLWGMRIASKGKAFGNEIADSMGISRNLFHTAVETGGFNMHLIVLASLKDEGKSVVDARELILPFLAQGLAALEQRFGRQNEIDHAKPIVHELLSE